MYLALPGQSQSDRVRVCYLDDEEAAGTKAHKKRVIPEAVKWAIDTVKKNILTLRVTPTPRAVRFRARPLCGLPRRGNPGPQIDVVVRATLPQCLRDAAGSNEGSGGGRRALLITSTARAAHHGSCRNSGV